MRINISNAENNVSAFLPVWMSDLKTIRTFLHTVWLTTGMLISLQCLDLYKPSSGTYCMGMGITTFPYDHFALTQNVAILVRLTDWKNSIKIATYIHLKAWRDPQETNLFGGGAVLSGSQQHKYHFLTCLLFDWIVKTSLVFILWTKTVFVSCVASGTTLCS